MSKKNNKSYFQVNLVPHLELGTPLAMKVESSNQFLVSVYKGLVIEIRDNDVKVQTGIKVLVDSFGNEREVECNKEFYFRYEATSPQKETEESIAIFRSRDSNGRDYNLYTFIEIGH